MYFCVLSGCKVSGQVGASFKGCKAFFISFILQLHCGGALAAAADLGARAGICSLVSLLSCLHSLHGYGLWRRAAAALSLATGSCKQTAHRSAVVEAGMKAAVHIPKCGTGVAGCIEHAHLFHITIRF